MSQCDLSDLSDLSDLVYKDPMAREPREPHHRQTVDPEQVKATFYLSPEQHQRLKIRAAEEGMSMSALVALWIDSGAVVYRPGGYVETGGGK